MTHEAVPVIASGDHTDAQIALNHIHQGADMAGGKLYTQIDAVPGTELTDQLARVTFRVRPIKSYCANA